MTDAKNPWVRAKRILDEAMSYPAGSKRLPILAERMAKLIQSGQLKLFPPPYPTHLPATFVDLEQVPEKRPPTTEETVVGKVKKLSLEMMQTRLVEIIDDNYEALHEAIDELKCGGDCQRCPNPERFPEMREQVSACLKNTVESLDLDRALLEP